MADCYLTGQTAAPMGDLASQPVGLTAQAADGAVSLSWQAPEDPAYQGVRICRGSGTAPGSPWEGMLLYEGSATACTDQQVTPGETYVYRAFAKNSWGDYQTSRCQVSCQVPVAKTLGQAEAGQTVRLAEDGTDQDYLVLAHGYPAAGRTLLLRRHAVSNTMFDSKVANEYNGSLLDQQCTALLGRLDQAIRPLVEAVEIAYTTGGSHTLSQIQRQVFCLSLTEAGLDTGASANREGQTIQILVQHPEWLVAESNGNPYSWWTRSPVLTDGTQAFAVDKEGQAELRMANRVTGVRPALTLPSDQVIVEEDGHLRPKEE